MYACKGCQSLKQGLCIHLTCFYQMTLKFDQGKETLSENKGNHERAQSWKV